MLHRLNVEIDEEHFEKLKEIRKTMQVLLPKALYTMIDQKYNELKTEQSINKILE